MSNRLVKGEIIKSVFYLFPFSEKIYNILKIYLNKFCSKKIEFCKILNIKLSISIKH